MRAVVLAGGQGRRLYPYTACLPKPLVPVGDRPILELLLLQLERAGVTRATLAVGHMAELVMAFFGSGARCGLEIDYALEERPLSTAGPLRQVAGLDERFLVLNGDLLTNLAVPELVAHHAASGAALTLATTTKHVQLQLGVIESDAAGTLTGFREKPALSFQVSTGIYVAEPRVLEHIPPDAPFGFDALMLRLLERGERVATFRHEGIWYDIGSPEDYALAVEHYERDPAAFLPAADSR